MKAAQMAPSFARAAALAAAVLVTCGCGASIQAVYEGDVRFEQCMALDARPAASAGAQRDCWDDWVAYYTYGQTRDRLVYAQRRIRELDGRGPRPAYGEGMPASAVEQRPQPPLKRRPDAGNGRPEGIGPELLGPGRLSAAPGGAAANHGAAGDRAEPEMVDGEIEEVRCAGQCQAVHDACSRSCTTSRCRKTCSVGFKTCVRGCG